VCRRNKVVREVERCCAGNAYALKSLRPELSLDVSSGEVLDTAHWPG